MIPPDDKQKFLDKLEDMPIVSVVCRNVGISKASVYRWREEDSEFKKRFDRALKRGRETLVDHAESKLVKLVDKENLGAIKMVLEANSKRYYRPRKPMAAPKEPRYVKTIEMLVVRDGNSRKETRYPPNEHGVENQRMKPQEEERWESLSE